jgi:3-hydroxybutyryl-CoA dehydratase
MPGIRERTIEGLRPGDTFTLARTFTEELTRAFGELSRDFNPVHYDRRFAGAKGFPGLICHGLLVGSLLTELGGQMGMLATTMDFRFLRPVYPGDTITCRLTLTSIDERGRAEGSATFTSQDGVRVVEATLAGRLPGPEERAVLAAMMAEGDPTNGAARDG